jgi:hypothetical protein
MFRSGNIGKTVEQRRREMKREMTNDRQISHRCTSARRKSAFQLWNIYSANAIGIVFSLLNSLFIACALNTLIASRSVLIPRGIISDAVRTFESPSFAVISSYQHCVYMMREMRRRYARRNGRRAASIVSKYRRMSEPVVGILSNNPK